jgi:hypothetical protein
MRLNKSQKYAIQWMVSQGHEITQIVKELKISTDIVNSFIEKYCKHNQDNSIQTKSGPLTSKDLMIRKTSSKGNNTVAIMTREASQTGDEFKKSLPDATSRNSHVIHKINE